ncbi:GIY-YIG nuclease family protein [Streptomyces sp. NPDC055243]|uniref:GIY-YIG nuclease family protein n=1 Tax=Streptomyces sp. NPDC055243 TaxID=3365720 RepID=UPI0037D7C31B
MLIIHPAASPENAAQAILNAMQDERLSFRARGLLGLLLSHPGEKWDHCNLNSLAADISKRQKVLTGAASGQGAQAIRNTLCELEEAGYLVRRLIGNGVNPESCIEVIDTPGMWDSIPPPADRDHDCDVYVVGQYGNPVVKIGTTSSLQHRVRSLQSGYPLRLEALWRTPGGWGLERYLHDHFADIRLQGEWFDFGDRDPVDAVAKAANARRGGHT